MSVEPIIFLVCSSTTQDTLEEILRRRYVEGYRIGFVDAANDPTNQLQTYAQQGEQVAVFVYEHDHNTSAFLGYTQNTFPSAHRLILSDGTFADTDAEHHFIESWDPPEKKLYPMLDELLADWRASTEMSFIYVKGIMTVRSVRIRIGDSLHRAAEIIALSGVGDLMVIDDNNNFVGVLSVGDVLRASMPDTDEIIEEGGTLEQAYRLFLRKGSELRYKPIRPLVITSPLVVDPDDHVAKVAALMLEKNIHRLPVVKDGRLLGTVGRADICQAVVGTL
jgi:CBS domain-containing protein